MKALQQNGNYMESLLTVHCLRRFYRFDFPIFLCPIDAFEKKVFTRCLEVVVAKCTNKNADKTITNKVSAELLWLQSKESFYQIKIETILSGSRSKRSINIESIVLKIGNAIDIIQKLRSLLRHRTFFSLSMRFFSSLSSNTRENIDKWTKLRTVVK